MVLFCSHVNDSLEDNYFALKSQISELQAAHAALMVANEELVS